MTEPIDHSSQLTTLLRERIARGAFTPHALATLLNVSDSYMTHLLNGTRPLSGVGKDKLRLIADQLEMPAMTVMLLAEYVSSEDFFAGEPAEIEDACYEAILAHPRWAGIAPRRTVWREMHPEAKAALVLMFESTRRSSIGAEALCASGFANHAPLAR